MIKFTCKINFYTESEVSNKKKIVGLIYSNFMDFSPINWW